MKKSTATTNKLLLEILPDKLSPDKLPEIFSRSKIQYLRQNNVKTAIIVSSKPVDSKTYHSLVDMLNKRALSVSSFYFDANDETELSTLKAAAQDLDNSLLRGGCIILSYRSNFALTFIASLYILKGKKPDEAVSFINKIKQDIAADDLNRGLLNRFYNHVSQSALKESITRDAVMINKKFVEKKPADTPESGSIAAMPEYSKNYVDGNDGKKELSGITAESRKSEKGSKEYQARAAAADFASIKTGPFYRSIRFKLIFIISIIIMTSLSGMIFLASYFFKNDNMIRIQENNLQLAEVIALKIKSEIEKYELVSSAMMDSSRKTAIAGYENLLAIGDKDVIFVGTVEKSEKGDAQKFIKSFYNKPLMNKHGLAEKDIAALNKSNDKVYELSFNGENIIHNISPYINIPALALTYPYERDNGKVRSIQVALIKLDSLLKTFKTAGIIKIYMVNYKGDVIAHPDLNLMLNGANFSSVPICALMMKSKIDNGQTRFGDDKGIFYLGSFKKIDPSGFGIIATAKESEAFEAVYRIQNRNMIITAIVLTAAILFIFFFGKTITSPIIHLVGATKKIIQGQFHVDILPASRDEIGQLTSTFIEMGKGLEEREKIKSAFGKFVNKDLAEAALKDEIRLGGERKKVTILFSDIRSFTEISEKLEPEQVVEFLNHYMTKMVACIEKMDGIVDKFIGDAIMAVWGTPISKGNDTENAINSALLMRKELIHYNKEQGGSSKPVINMGCGINTGIVLAGQIGTENRMEYTVIGDPVNLASRIEALNKIFGTDILITEDSYALVKNIFAVERMRQIKVKGKAQPQQIYAVLGRMDDPDRSKTLSELQARLGIVVRTQVSDEAMDKLIEYGEEKYEIIEK